MINEKSIKADINIATAASHTIITAPSGTSEYIAIDHINLNSAGNQTVQLKDGTTAYGGVYSFGANGNLVLDNSSQNQDGVITLSSGSAFVITLTAAVQVSGFVRYRIINR